MKTFNKVIINTILISITFLILSLFLGFKFNDIKAFFNESYKYEKVETVKVDETIRNIDISVSTKNLLIESHDLNYITIDYYLKKNEKVNFDTNNNTLNINQTNKNQLFNINFQIAKKEYRTIIINMPKENFESININTKVSNVELDSFNVNNLSIKITTGNLYLNEIKSKDININSSTGNINIKNITTNNLITNSNTGNTNVNNSEIEKINLKTNTGNITVYKTNIKESNFKASTGNINITILTLNHSLELKTNTGNIKINNKKVSKDYKLTVDSNYFINAKTSTGNIKLKELS